MILEELLKHVPCKIDQGVALSFPFLLKDLLDMILSTRTPNCFCECSHRGDLWILGSIELGLSRGVALEEELVTGGNATETRLAWNGRQTLSTSGDDSSTQPSRQRRAHCVHCFLHVEEERWTGMAFEENTSCVTALSFAAQH